MGGQADLGYVRITMVHANHCTGAQLEQSDYSSGNGSRSGSGGSSQRSGRSQGSSLRSAMSMVSNKSSGSTSGMSFSGGAAAGWVI